MSFNSNYLKIAEMLTNLIKDSLSIPVIWGGVHATVSPKESLNTCDIVCLGEGEEALWELFNTYTQSNKNYQISNLWFKSGDQIIKNGQRPPMANLDILPYQDYEIENHFILKKGLLRQLKISDLQRNFVFSLTRMMTFGCPFRCTYCVNDRYQYLDSNNSRIRRYSVDYFVRETKYILSKLTFINYLLFDDDAFLSLPKEVIEEFSVKYKKEINLPFGIGGIRAEMVKREKLAPLLKAGLITVRMGIQSGSERINREIFHRQFSKERTFEAASIFESMRSKLRPPFYDIILDNPWENMQDKLETLNFLKELPRPYFLNAFSLTFFPGTQLYERALKENIINGYDPQKHYHRIKRTFLNLLMLSLGMVRYPNWLYRRFINSKKIKDERKEYTPVYYIYALLNLTFRLLSFYINPRFLLTKLRRGYNYGT